MIGSRDKRPYRRAPSAIMVIPVQVTFRNMSTSDALETAIREKAAKLDRFHPRIMACRVAVEAARHRHMKGNVFHVRFDVTVAHGEVVASSDTNAPTPHENVYTALSEAFHEIRRRLEDHAQRIRGEVKHHGGRRAG
jgi:ribosomal subunit interface protein